MSEIERAFDFIERRLPADGDWHAARDMYEAAAALGLTERTLRLARERLGISVKREAAVRPGVLWRWNGQRPDAAQDAAWAEIEAARALLDAERARLDAEWRALRAARVRAAQSGKSGQPRPGARRR